MEHKENISKWLNGELSGRELEEFKKTSDYRQYRSIVEYTSRLEQPAFDPGQNLAHLKERMASDPVTPSRTSAFSLFFKVAAIVVVLLASGTIFWLNKPTTVSTGMAEVTSLALPDESLVRLNADSRLRYKPSRWDRERSVSLKGEAFFEVHRGNTFSVEAGQGKVTVLGTKFNVRNRPGYFEVRCYHGAVQVNFGETSRTLEKGDSFLIIDGEIRTQSRTSASAPAWTQQESKFEAVPLKHVIKELERQFDLRIATRDLDLEQLFTGSFSHQDKELALKAICIPLELNFRFESEKKVVLYEQ